MYILHITCQWIEIIAGCCQIRLVEINDLFHVQLDRVSLMKINWSFLDNFI